MASNLKDLEARSKVVVCGAGIIGLTTSVRLLEAGYAATIVASHLPGDPLSIYYASAAAGAHHLSFAPDDDERLQMLDQRTFDVMWKEEEEEGEVSGLMRIVQHEYYGNEGERHIKFFESLPDFRIYSTQERPASVHHAVSFTTLTMDTAPYLDKLVARIKDLGGTIYRATLSSLASALDIIPGSPPIAIVNCTGLGSLGLNDVQDTDMFPIRGQVIVLKAPWIKEGHTKQVGKLIGGERTYTIPRRSGEVVIGGTREVDDWTPEPRAETSYDIKRRALALCPELAPVSVRISGKEPVPEDLDSIVVHEVVGMRPARKGGLRLQRGADLIVDSGHENQMSIPVFHNIGHSGAGWQSCWGCAEEIVRMVQGL